MMYKNERELITKCAEAFRLLTNDDTFMVFSDLIKEIVGPNFAYALRFDFTSDDPTIIITPDRRDESLFHDQFQEEDINVVYDNDKIYLTFSDLLQYLLRMDSKTLIQTMIVQDEIKNKEDLEKRIYAIESKLDRILDKLEPCSCEREEEGLYDSPGYW